MGGDRLMLAEPAPVSAVPSRGPGGARRGPAVATEVAAGLLRGVGLAVVEEDGELLRVGADLACRVAWAGPSGPAVGSESDVQAACGLMHVHGRRYGAPTPLGVDFASVAAGVLAATGTLAALWARRSGAVAYREVGVSVAQAALFGLSQYLAAATAPDRECVEPAGPGGPPFESADGVWFELEALEADGWLRFWRELGVGRGVVGRAWLPFQARYGTATCPLPEELFAATRAVPYQRLVRVAEESGVGITVAVPRPAVVGGLPWRIRAAEAASAAGRPDGGAGGGPGPLAGVRVVEIARRVQGPVAGRVLALLGAEVVRVEPPGGDPLRGVPPMADVDGAPVSARFAALNRGKAVLEADLRSREGRAAVEELLRSADVLLHSLAPAKVAGLGLDAPAVAALRPGLVYAQASGGAPGLSTDYPVQAYSGLAALLAPAGGPPRPTLLTVCDVLGGLVCAAGTVAGLEARVRTGRAQRVESSLLSAARLLCGASAGGPGPGGGVEVCTDLAALVADPRRASAFEVGADGCAFVRAPWEFR